MPMAPGAPQQAAPQPGAQDPQAGQQGGGAAEAVSMVNTGLMQLKKIIESSGDALGPQEKQEFMGLMNGWQAFVDELSNPAGQEKPQAPGPQGPMPENAAPKGSAPAY